MPKLHFYNKRTRPLYFALEAVTDFTYRLQASQPDITNILKHEPRDDLKKIIDEVCSKDQSKSKNPHIILRLTADELNGHHKERKFYMLELFYKKVEDSRMNYGTLDVESRSRLPWMQYHANRTNFDVTAKSIQEMPANIFEGGNLVYRKKFIEWLR